MPHAVILFDLRLPTVRWLRLMELIDGINEAWEGDSESEYLGGEEDLEGVILIPMGGIGWNET